MQRLGAPTLVGPRGRGGVAAVLDLLAPIGGDRLEPREAWRLAGRRAAVHLHTSLRPRALARDALLASTLRGPLTVSWHGWDPALADLARRSPLARAGAHVVLTDAQRLALLAWGVDPERIVRAANPIDPRIAPAPRPAGPPTALFLGRLEAGKGPVELVRAFALAGRREPELRLVLAGDGALRPDVVAAIGRAGLSERTHLVGWLGPEAKRRWLARASVLALPSRDEAFPLAVAEALAAEVPVVATRVGAVPELVDTAGVLVDSTDPEVLADALLAIVRAPPATIGAVGARVRELCDPARVADDWRRAWGLATAGTPTRSGT